MKPSAYWIEDELDLLEHTIGCLEKETGSTVVQYPTALMALNALPQIEKERAPILLDLWLPEEDELDRLAGQALSGPRVGLFLLERIQEKLGRDFAVFIVSGNLSADVERRLKKDNGIPSSRIYVKPLNDRNDDLVAEVVKLMRDGVA